jgi:predicted transcriptional regulator
MGMQDSRIFKVQREDEYGRLFNQIISELQLKRSHFNEVVNAAFMTLLSLMSRKIGNNNSVYAPRSQLVDDAISLFHSEYAHLLKLALTQNPVMSVLHVLPGSSSNR